VRQRTSSCCGRYPGSTGRLNRSHRWNSFATLDTRQSRCRTSAGSRSTPSWRAPIRRPPGLSERCIQRGELGRRRSSDTGPDCWTRSAWQEAGVRARATGTHRRGSEAPGPVWRDVDAIAAAQRELASFNPQLRYQGFGGNSRLLNIAGQVVGSRPIGKPDSARLAAYRGRGDQ